MKLPNMLMAAALAAIMGAAAPARGQSASEGMPLKISERLWQKPGPAGEEGAPKLLVIYPDGKAPLAHAEEKTRYAGRVEPADAEVAIDGKPVTVYPGGVFTGLLDIPVGMRDVTFTARAKGEKTSITRSVERKPRELGPAEWPLAFHKSAPVFPDGKEDYWLRPGGELKVKLFASPGHEASMRADEGGEWVPMKAARATPEQGGAYEGILTGGKDFASEQPTAILFRLRSAAAGADRPSRTIETTSKLKVRLIPEGAQLAGEITKNLGTFLQREEGWDRWGNWNGGTIFPIKEKRGERVSVDFGAGEAGLVEMEASKVSFEPREAPRPALGKPEARWTPDGRADRLILEWKTPRPLASVFYPSEPGADGTLAVSLIGAAEAEAAEIAVPAPAFISALRVLPKTSGAPPRIEARLRERELWGYGWSRPDAETLRLTIRAKPEIADPGKEKPLRGLKIMVDAGHGGSDMGAIGPSGLAEADVNLVVSAHLGLALEKMGAKVKHTRRDDSFVDLDDRVDMALAWDPDLFVSVHHNSVPMTSHPMADKGPKVFFHYPHSIPLASEVAAKLTDLLEAGEKPEVLKQVFRVNRNVSPCPSILVEGGFVCHPEDEIRLRDSKTLKAMAGAIADGIAKLWAKD